MDAALDADLVRRIAAGDAEAVGALYDRYARALWPLALRVLRDRAEAEDALHDAFVVVARRASSYAPERGSVAGWLVTLVRNQAIDRARRRARRGALLRRADPHDAAARAADPEALVAGRADRAGVRRALAALPRVQRLTLLAAFYDGLSYPEIAARDGLALGTVKSRAARALAALRAALDRTPAPRRSRRAA